MKPLPLRALPRLFVPGANAADIIELPGHEVDKLRKVLRLGAGAEIGVLPNDGTIIRCGFTGREAVPRSVERPDVEPRTHLTVLQALPKGDKLDEIVRACTEIGVSAFVLFPSERTVVKWDERKVADRISRLETIAREAAEVSFRTRLPSIRYVNTFKAALDDYPECIVLSEAEVEEKPLPRATEQMSIAVGPEGGWSKAEIGLIGARGVTLGPRVLRVDHAAPVAAGILLLSDQAIR